MVNHSSTETIVFVPASLGVNTLAAAKATRVRANPADKTLLKTLSNDPSNCICVKFIETKASGGCRFGDNCTFVHDPRKLLQKSRPVIVQSKEVIVPQVWARSPAAEAKAAKAKAKVAEAKAAEAKAVKAVEAKAAGTPVPTIFLHIKGMIDKTPDGKGIPCCRDYMESQLNHKRNLINERDKLPIEYWSWDTQLCTFDLGSGSHPCHPPRTKLKLCDEWLTKGMCSFTCRNSKDKDMDPDVAGLCDFIHPRELKGSLTTYLDEDRKLWADDIQEEKRLAKILAERLQMEAYQSNSSWYSLPEVSTPFSFSLCMPCSPPITSISCVVSEKPKTPEYIMDTHPDVYNAWKKDPASMTWSQFSLRWIDCDMKWFHPFVEEENMDGKKGFAPKQTPLTLAEIYGVATLANNMAPFWDYFYGRDPSPLSYVVKVIKGVRTSFEELVLSKDEQLESMERNIRLDNDLEQKIKNDVVKHIEHKSVLRSSRKEHKQELKKERTAVYKYRESTRGQSPPRAPVTKKSKTKWGTKNGDAHVVKERSSLVLEEIAANKRANEAAKEANSQAKEASKKRRSLNVESEINAGKFVAKAPKDVLEEHL